MELKYHYVVLASEWDLYKISYSELNDFNDADYIGGLPHLFGEGFGKFLNSIAIRINLPFVGNLINRKLDRDLKKITKPLCFIFFGNWVEYDMAFNLINHINSQYPHAKTVWFNQDLVATHLRIQKKIDEVMKKFDLVLSFDYGDCKKYNMLYHPLVFTDVTSSFNTRIENDIYFLGKAKNRLTDILKAYSFFKSKSLKLDFNIVGVPLELQKYKDDIHYIESMSYTENLKHVAKSRCILEVMQKTGTGFTSRVNEAICFGKKMITNNTMIEEAPFYNSNYISVFDDRFEFDEDFVQKLHKGENVNYEYKKEISPIKFLSFIDERL